MTSPVQIQLLARIVKGQFMYPPLHPTYTTGFSIDTRTLRKGDVFIAIKGEHFNGNDFVEKAFLKEACCAIVSRLRWQRGSKRDESTEMGPGPLITVSDTIQALSELGNYFRRRLRGKVVAVTGSLGKTATRELIYSVLAEAGEADRSIKNYNNIYGVPLSILGAKPNCDYLVLEMGMSQKGEISRLADICEPDVGVVTNVSTSHTEFFETLDDVADAKAELFPKIPKKGALFINADDRRLMDRASRAECEVITFGFSESDCQGKSLASLGEKGFSFEVTYRGETSSFACPLLGEHNVKNALAAVAVGKYFGLSSEEIGAGLLKVSRPPHRLNLVKSADGRLRILDDSYNSSPAAARAAIEVLLALRSKVDPDAQVALVLADMLELGEIEESEHYKLGVFIASRNIDRLLLMGPLSEHIARGAIDSGFAPDRVTHNKSFMDLRDAVQSLEGGWMLIKGSRAWGLDRLAHTLAIPSTQEFVGEEEQDG